MSQKNDGDTRPGSSTPAAISPTTARNRALVAIALPPATMLLIAAVRSVLFAPSASNGLTDAAPLFAALALASWFIGLRFYGLRGMALRGGRPLFAGIGFAVLVWVAALIGRFLPMAPQAGVNESGQAVINIILNVQVMDIRSAEAGRAFVYLLLFEAFATQLWAFGLVFRSLADWLGGLTAAVVGGILFGAIGYLAFSESFVPGLPTLFYFLLWGIVYGLIRLRTGGILGSVLIQAMQSFTAWFVFQPPNDMAATGIRTVYIATGLLFAVIAWRLWPRREDDYRI